MAQRAAPGVCRFVFSADLQALVRCRIDRLVPKAQAEELIGDDPLDLVVELVLDGEVTRAAQSNQPVFDASPENGAFRPQHFVYAMKLRDLPRRCSLLVRLRAKSSEDGTPRAFRGALPLFNRRAVLRQGKQLLALVPDDPRGEESMGRAPRDWHRHSNEAVLEHGPHELREALRFVKARDFLDRGCLVPAALGLEGSEEHFEAQALSALEAAGLPWVRVHLPVFPHTVVFAEPRYDSGFEVPGGVVAAPLWEEAVGGLDMLESAGWLLKAPEAAGEGRKFKYFVDRDAQQEHPAVLKSLRLARASRSIVKDRDARPDHEELKRLKELVQRPRRQFASEGASRKIVHFSAEEKHFLFRFRWSLTDNPSALTKFLHAVDWSDLEERQHAIELLGHWSPVDIDDALELLSKDFRGMVEVRRHAIERLEQAKDDELQMYLLQLVQALRYESGSSSLASGAVGSPPEAGDDSTPDPDRSAERSTLAGFLVSRARRCRDLAVYLHWYLVAEADGDRERGPIFDFVRQRLLDALSDESSGAGGRAIKRILDRQVALRHKLLWCLHEAKVHRARERQIERFRQALREEPPDALIPLDLVGGLDEGIPLPVDPRITLWRVDPDNSSLMKSAMRPAVLMMEVEDNEGTRRPKLIMFKEGDDLRQDQLILQLIILLDSLFKRYGVDMRLSPYQVSALSGLDGFVEFVKDGQNISTILKDYNNDIQQFFRRHHPRPDAQTGDCSDRPRGAAEQYTAENTYGIKAEVLDNFIKSSAGYCVITYILGIGDRHLDNIMITKDGLLYHIDFGFILGRDPKPFPPPMRICKEMVEAMGGSNSPGYQSFKSKCCQAYKILRRHSKLIINLLYLMTDSGIKDLCGDPQFAIGKVEQKFQALMDDEQAEVHFINLLDESVKAIMPAIMEVFHQISVARH